MFIVFKKIKNIIKCIFGNHEWDYYGFHYYSGKDIFKCSHCFKKIKE
jgi:hypothetical protein